MRRLGKTTHQKDQSEYDITIRNLKTARTV